VCLELLAKMKEFKKRERRLAHPIDVRKTQSRNCPGVQYPRPIMQQWLGRSHETPVKLPAWPNSTQTISSSSEPVPQA